MAVTENDLVVGPLTPALGVDTISLDFFFENQEWLQVYRGDSDEPLVLNVDYNVIGDGTQNGFVTLAEPADGVTTYAVYLSVPLRRSSDLQLRGQFRSDPYNTELDRVWQALQGLRSRIERAFSVSRTSNPPDPLFSISEEERSNRTLIFSGDGTGLSLGPSTAAISGADAAANSAIQAAEAALASQAIVLEAVSALTPTAVIDCGGVADDLTPGILILPSTGADDGAF